MSLGKKAGPLVYAFTCVTVYGFLINCGDTPTLSRISSKCWNASRAIDGDHKNEKSKLALTGESPSPGKGGVADAPIESLSLDSQQDFDDEAEFLGLVESPETYYNSNVKSIISGKCISCHAYMGNYSGIKNKANVILDHLKAANGKSLMPPAGKLPDTEMDLFVKWSELLSTPSSEKDSKESPSTGSKTSTSSSTRSLASASAKNNDDECRPDHSAPGTATGTGKTKNKNTRSNTRTSTNTGTTTKTK